MNNYETEENVNRANEIPSNQPGSRPDDHPGGTPQKTIYVNARAHTWDKPTISFEEVIKLAFSDYTPNPKIAYTVSFFDGPKGKEEGQLTARRHIPVKDGEKFDVDRTNNS